MSEQNFIGGLHNEILFYQIVQVKSNIYTNRKSLIFAERLLCESHIKLRDEEEENYRKLHLRGCFRWAL